MCFRLFRDIGIADVAEVDRSEAFEPMSSTRRDLAKTSDRVSGKHL